MIWLSVMRFQTDCFKEISTECQKERDIDDQPIYLDAPVTVAESSLLLMAFAVRHKLSGIALEDLLELIHFDCPKPNKCITELKEFQLFFQALTEASSCKAFLLPKCCLQSLYWNIPARDWS